MTRLTDSCAPQPSRILDVTSRASKKGLVAVVNKQPVRVCVCVRVYAFTPLTADAIDTAGAFTALSLATVVAAASVATIATATTDGRVTALG
jgi:hypothetical protein